MQKPMVRLLGGWAVFFSAFCFYLSTVVIRWAQAEVSIAPPYFVFARLALGFLIVLTALAYRRQLPRPRSYHLLLGRTAFNCTAVYCFYTAVELTSVAEANLLNMTYPVFVALTAWIVLRDKFDLASLAMVVVASLIGAKGLGEDVLEALQYANVGQGILAGFSILFCAMILDRIVQGDRK